MFPVEHCNYTVVIAWNDAVCTQNSLHTAYSCSHKHSMKMTKGKKKKKEKKEVKGKIKRKNRQGRGMFQHNEDYRSTRLLPVCF